MEAPKFEPWPSIPRLKRGCVITEKIDGTNAQVYVCEDGQIWAGSRNRWVTPESDNYGFARWVQEHAEELKALGPGSHYGEWWGAGIQRRYGLTERRFSLFNTSRWGGENKDRPACCGVVPVLYAGDYTATIVDEVMEKLRAEGSVAAPGFMNPEGVVVYLPAARAMFKVTLDGDGHKSTTRSSVPQDPSMTQVAP
jgi:hypothetical protein